ncbi:hypothetical protein HL658_08450 [Azospirillum sp. RWY-5-1]|uniref:Uncharacterized protein n=1 Tax=Azospirillum oleiclasticum TaxID=2735135 RepID=A0ABX2T6Q5_9PROT|nr:hypothetical protein [Azospirillum oleiclasticum]NYZ12577.1 hypothetical protein [Azospirillum oleiclasticum]NYZ19737.1 hypothetical protein [Azospirillum oleiclasticum]
MGAALVRGIGRPAAAALAALLLVTALAAPPASAERRAREPARETGKEDSRGARESGRSGSDPLEQRQREREGVEGSRTTDGPLGQRQRESEAMRRDGISPSRRTEIHQQADRAIANGECFNRNGMSAERRQRLDAWQAGGPEGREASRLGRQLGEMRGEEVVRHMEREVASGRVREGAERQIPAATEGGQRMRVWEYPDGTVIRYKPKGDSYRRGPTHSVEVKIDRNVRDGDARDQGIAFKVDGKGRAVPRGPADIRIPDRLTGNEITEYQNRIMDAGHMGTPRGG